MCRPPIRGLKESFKLLSLTDLLCIAMDSLASPVEDTLSVFDIQNDINLIDTINSKIQQMDSLKDQSLASYSTRIEGM